MVGGGCFLEGEAIDSVRRVPMLSRKFYKGSSLPPPLLELESGLQRLAGDTDAPGTFKGFISRVLGG